MYSFIPPPAEKFGVSDNIWKKNNKSFKKFKDISKHFCDTCRFSNRTKRENTWLQNWGSSQTDVTVGTPSNPSQSFMSCTWLLFKEVSQCTKRKKNQEKKKIYKDKNCDSGFYRFTPVECLHGCLQALPTKVHVALENPFRINPEMFGFQSQTEIQFSSFQEESLTVLIQHQ